MDWLLMVVHILVVVPSSTFKLGNILCGAELNLCRSCIVTTKKVPSGRCTSSLLYNWLLMHNGCNMTSHERPLSCNFSCLQSHCVWISDFPLCIHVEHWAQIHAGDWFDSHILTSKCRVVNDVVLLAWIRTLEPACSWERYTCKNDNLS